MNNNLKLDLRKKFSASNIIMIIIISVSFLIFINIYLDFKATDESNVIVTQKFSDNDFFNAKIEIKNPAYKKHVITNDFLTYSMSIEPKREDILNFAVEINVLYGEQSVQKLKDENYSFRELNTSQRLQFIFHLENTGQHIIQTKISLIDLPEEKIDRDENGEMIGISVPTDWTLMNLIESKTVLEALQTENLENQQFNMALTGSIGAITAIALVANFIISHRQSNFLKEQNEISKNHVEYLGVLEVMKSFNNDENGKRRDELYTAFQNRHLYDGKDYVLDKDMMHNVASIRGNYDMIGSLVKGDFVQKQKVLGMYAESIITMYKVLRPHINYERTRRKSRNFAADFEWIFQEAKKYWKENYPDVAEPDPIY